ncbi:MAG: ATP-binding protein [Alphaproteobacteria bacterium]
MATYTPLDVSTNENRITVSGGLRTAEMRYLFAAIFNTVSNKGYKDIVLDLSNLGIAFAPPILALACICRNYLVEGIDTELVLPRDSRLSSIFANANWAHIISPMMHPKSSYQGTKQLPAMQFQTPQEQHQAVSKIMDQILGTLDEIEKSHLSAIEWSVNEVTDNVLNHSESRMGGLVQVTKFEKNRKEFEFCVADAGLGIPYTLRQGHPEIRSDSEALDRAIREGVTRGVNYGQGNGLYGSFRIAESTEGSFEIQSGNASFFYNQKDKAIHSQNQNIPFSGTLVSATVGYNNPLVLENVLEFNNRKHVPVDSIDLKYGDDESGNLIFPLRNESEGYGTRGAGATVRTKILNLAKFSTRKVIIDLEKIRLVSSSGAVLIRGGVS